TCSINYPAPPLTSAPADELSRRAPRCTGGCILPQESRNAAGRLAQKLPASEHGPRPAPPAPSPDVLPEILRHTMPLRPTLPPPNSTLYGPTRWALPSGGAEAAGVSPDVLNPLRSYVALPQATFGLGPKRCASGAFGIDLMFSLKVVLNSGALTMCMRH
uniref:Uncharacterized protein n=1 Tax=Aegilops tauschii subsp. strangulata TaxID=200361 RepID=A0A453R8B3_AEGTS